MLVNENTVIHCLLMLVHSALMLTNTTFDFNNVLVNVEINIKINKCWRSS